MGLTLLAPPAAEPIALAEAKAHLRVDTDADDAVIATLIAGVRRVFERATGLALIDQSWRLTLDQWPHKRVRGLRAAPLPVRPVGAIDALTLDPGAPGETVVESGDIVLDAGAFPPHLVEAAAGAFPDPLLPTLGIRIDFTAGFGPASADAPADMRHALLRLLAEAYERRGVTREGEPLLARALYEPLVAPFREPRL